MKHRQWIALQSTMAVLVSTIVSTTQVYAHSNQNASTMTIAISNDVVGFDPQKTASASTFEVINNLYDGLVEVNAKGAIVPGLATHWASSDGGKKWTFTLRPGVLFQNGKTLTAEDVKYTFNRILDKATADPNVSDFSAIQSIAVNGQNKVTFTLNGVYAPFLSTLALPWAVIIEQGTGDNLTTKPIGTGPYQLVSYTPQQAIVLQKFNRAWDEKDAHIQTVKFEIVPNAATQLLDLQSGSVDVAPVDAASAAVVARSTHLTLLDAPANDVQVMAMNNKAAPLNNVLVRRAIAYAVNKQDIIQAVDFGYGKQIGSHLSPVSPYYVNENGINAFNVVRAKQLLKQAGYATGLTLNMALPQPYTMHVQTGQIIAQQLKQVGINVNISVIPWAQWLQNVYLGRQYQLTVIDHTGRLDPAQLLNRYQTGNSGNYFNFSDSLVDKDLTLGATTMNRTKRHFYYAQVQLLLAKDAAAVYIQSPDALVGLNQRVSGWKLYPIDIDNLRGVFLKS